MKFKMSPKVEDSLRKGMTKLGGLVERAIGHAKKAKSSVQTSHSVVEPILALESQLTVGKLKELTSVSIERLVTPIIPNLIDKASLEIIDGPSKFGRMIKDKGSAVAIHADISVSAGSYPKETLPAGVNSVRATVRTMPFEDGFFDFVLANLATNRQGDIVKTIKEIGRQTALGGEVILVDFHPFGRFAKKGSVRLKSIESVVRGVEDYFKMFGLAGFVVNGVKEAFVDETVRTLFETPEEKAGFRQIKDTPLLIVFNAIKKMC